MFPERLSIGKQVVFATITIVGFFALIEIVLWLAGIQRITQDADPYVGFSSTLPLFVEEQGPDGQPCLRTAQNKLTLFNPARFPKQKGDNVFRVFSLGGSTTHGRPYTDALSFSGWLRELLPLADPNRQWEVINAGGISYASYRVAVLMEELLRYEPDLFLLYVGHNEFLESRTYPHLVNAPRLLTTLAGLASRTRLYAAGRKTLVALKGPSTKEKTVLRGEVSTILEHSVGPEDYHRNDALRKQIFEHFRYNMNRLVEMARAGGADVILITPASNLKDCSPFRSEPGDRMDTGSAKRFEALMTAAATAGAEQDWEEAAGLLTQARRIDDRYAELHYRLGRALYRLGRYEESKAAFQRAVEEDVCPLRAPRRISEIIAAVAASKSVPLVDFAETVRQRAPNGIPGSEHFLDHIHLNADGYGLLARGIVDTLAREQMLQLSGEWNEQNLASARRRVLARLEGPAYGESLLNLAKVFGWAGKHTEAERFARQAGEFLGQDPEVYRVLGHLASTQGDLEAAVRYLSEAVRIQPDHAGASYGLGTALYLQGRYEDAVPHFASALRNDPVTYLEAHNNLGLSLEALGEREQAISEYRAVLRVEPDHIEARNNLGAALLSQGFAAEAIQHFRRVLALQPARAEAHFNLGLNLTRLGRTEEAIETLQQAVRIRPGYPEAHDNLGSAFALAGKADRAMRHFQEAARLRTDWAPPLLHMAQLLTTFPDENIRDGERAVRYAEQAAELTQYQDADVLDVLAASYAEQGRFPEAVRTAQRALLLYQQAGVTGAATALRRRAKSYENRLSDQRP